MKPFADSNVLLYSISDKPLDAGKREIARRLLDGNRCIVSVQVLNEFIWQSTSARRGFGFSAASARALTDAWCKGFVQALDVAMFQRAWDVEARTNYSWWDCLIIAAALTAGCDVLYSEDMHHGHVIDGVRIENPFRDLG